MKSIEIIAVGLPFGYFKVITGLRVLEWFPTVAFVGWALIALGCIDLLINTVNLFGFLVLKRRLFDTCFFAAVGRLLRQSASPIWTWQDLGISVDTLLAMSIVAYMIGSNAFSSFPETQLKIWNVCVILNVLFAGFSRLRGSIMRVSEGLPIDRRAAN